MPSDPYGFLAYGPQGRRPYYRRRAARPGTDRRWVWSNVGKAISGAIASAATGAASRYVWPSAASKKYTGRSRKRQVSSSRMRYNKYRGKRRRRFGRRRKRAANKFKFLTGQMSGLQTLRNNSTGVMSIADNENKFFEFVINDSSIMDGYGDDIYRFNYDDTVSAMERIAPDLRSLNGAGVKLASGFFKMTLRNNASTDCVVRFWVLTPKKDTSNSVLTVASNSATDLTVEGGTTNGEPLRRISDLDNIKRFFKVERYGKTYMHTGNEYEIFTKIKPQTHIFDEYDQHALQFRKYKSQILLINVEGRLGHDITNATTEVGLIQAQVDYIYEKKVNLYGHRQHGAKTIQTSNNVDTFTTTGVQYMQDDPAEESFAN